MTVEYQKKSAGYALPVNFGMVSPTIKERIDIPKIIANGAQAGLALKSAPDVGVAVPSTGFADGDTLSLWFVPKGTQVKEVGIYVITGEGATCTIDVGCQTAAQVGAGLDIDGAGIFNLETALAYDGTQDADGWGNDNLPGGEIYITNGSVDIEWNHDDTAVAEFEIWMEARSIGTLVANT